MSNRRDTDRIYKIDRIAGLVGNNSGLSKERRSRAETLRRREGQDLTTFSNLSVSARVLIPYPAAICIAIRR